MMLSAAHGDDYKPSIEGKSNQGKLAIQGFQIPDGMQAALVAAEPALANPVAFHVDRQGRIYVCETFRQQKGVEDNRSHGDWLKEDLSLQTVEERRAMFEKFIDNNAAAYRVEQDRIRLLEDTTGDGRVDRDTIFSGGYNDTVDGTGAGVLEWRGNVYYTCIPKLWKLRDADGDGVAEEKTALHSGYGVRVAFRGHDMHGLQVGPDGRIYYSIGDRGYNVETSDGRKLVRPNTGAVFRCEPDGSRLEVFAYGLRNPQELAFDDYGNLFTGDNNSDSGDQARWVYVVQGGDTGWRMHFQYLEDRGPWNRERMWYPYRADEETTAVQPAYIVPPIRNFADGPSGLTYYPGTGLDDRYKGHFFLADFRGTAGKSGIRSFGLEPRGASFSMVDDHKFIWSVLATDVDFGPDGSMYLTDWVNGWDGEGKGRIYRFTDQYHGKSAAVNEVRELLRNGFAKRTPEQLEKLLSHADKRVRQEAQFALVDQNATDVLQRIATDADADQMARIHAIWGIGQILRHPRDGEFIDFAGLFDDDDDEIRAQTVRMMADVLGTSLGPVAGDTAGLFDEPTLDILRQKFERMLSDANSRVRHFSALALGHVGTSSSVPVLLRMVVENNNDDPVLRHAGVMALTGIGQRDRGAILDARNHNESSARLVVLLALRRLGRQEIARFLADPDPRIVLEAARAIHDEPINGAMSDLAAIIRRPNLSDALLRRVLDANFRSGTYFNAVKIAEFAADRSNPNELRLIALNMLETWNEPDELDSVDGRFQPVKRLYKVNIAQAVGPQIQELFAGSDEIYEKAVRIVGVHRISGADKQLREVLADTKRSEELRVAALQALVFTNDSPLDSVKVAVNSDLPTLRAEGRRALLQMDPLNGIQPLADALDSGEIIEKQAAVEDLVMANNSRADTVLLKWARLLATGNMPPEIKLDVLTAAQQRTNGILGEQFEQALGVVAASRAADDHLAEFRECMSGGNSERGRDIFFGRSAASCRRCHLVDGNGGAVGPDLSSIGREKTREYLLESIVDPNKQIAKGFETTICVMEDGKVHTGIVKSDKDGKLTLMDPKGSTIVVEKSKIDERASGKSGMPEDMIKNLTKFQLRDLVEYLATRRSGKKKGNGTKHE